MRGDDAVGIRLAEGKRRAGDHGGTLRHVRLGRAEADGERAPHGGNVDRGDNALAVETQVVLRGGGKRVVHGAGLASAYSLVVG